MEIIQSIGVNEDVLKDVNRIQPFVQAINRNKHLFANKIVLDLDSGFGLLSILASKVGAKKVYALRSSTGAQDIIQNNNITNIELFEKDIKQVELNEKVDIIISSWMGNLLFYGGHILELIYARDKYLIENGLIFPDRGQLFIQSLEDGRYREQKLKFWDSVYGVKMNHMKQWVLREPLLESIKEEQLNSDPQLIYEVDLYTCVEDDLTYSNAYQLKINKQDYATGVIVWMKYSFLKTHLPIHVTMGPTNSPFWKPVILYFKDEIPIYKGDNLQGSFAVRFVSEELLEIKLSVHLQQYNYVQYFKLN